MTIKFSELQEIVDFVANVVTILTFAIFIAQQLGLKLPVLFA